MGLFEGLNQMGAGLQILWSWSKAKMIQGVDLVAQKNPMMRIYLDTPVGHPIEKEVEKAYSAACYKKIRSTAIGQWSDKLSIGLGKMIGQTSARILDFTKLNYQLATGKILLVPYLDEVTKRTLCGAAAVIDKGWAFIAPVVKNGLKGALGYVGLDLETAEKVSQAVSIGIAFTKSKVVDFMRDSKTIEVTQKAVRLVAEGVKTVVKKAKTVCQKVVKTVESVATVVKTTVGNLWEGAKNLLDSAKETIAEGVRSFAKKLWSWS